MASVNKVIIVGNLGRDPETRQLPSGGQVTNLAVATSRSYTNKSNNERVEETEWHRIAVFGKQAESCERYLAKGRQVYVEGRLKTTSYEKDGQKRYSTDIVADVVQFLGGRAEGDARPVQGSGRSPSPSTSNAPSAPSYDDDIPF